MARPSKDPAELRECAVRIVIQSGGLSARGCGDQIPTPMETEGGPEKRVDRHRHRHRHWHGCRRSRHEARLIGPGWQSVLTTYSPSIRANGRT